MFSQNRTFRCIVEALARLVCTSGRYEASTMQIKRAYLIMACVAVTIFALLYGISPTWYATTFLHISDLNPDVAHILRAVTGLYLALAAFWLYSAGKYRNTAVLTTILFGIMHLTNWIGAA
jgi:hypothetical protein